MRKKNSEYKELYKKAEEMYKSGKSLTQIGKILDLDRGRLSIKLKEKGINIVNYQNLTKFNNKIFDRIDNEEKSYWLGFLYADGSISSRDNSVELSLKPSDKDHLIKFSNFLNLERNIKINQDRCRLVLCDKYFKNQLINLGCIPNKSLILKFPKYLSADLIRHFIRGYFDGDGSFGIYISSFKGLKFSIIGTSDILNNIINYLPIESNKIILKRDKRWKNTETKFFQI